MSKSGKLVFYGSIAVIVVTVCILVGYFFTRAHDNDVYEDVQAAVTVTPAPVTAPETTDAPHVCPIDFDELHATAPDAYAWIEIPGMDISYPVLQSPTDDTLYLRHDLTGEYNMHGAIYSEASVDATDFSDYHTILYGHNFEDGTFFSDLTRYRDSTVLQQNHEIRIYTPEKELRYTIFAAVTYDNSYLPEYYDETIPESRQLFLDDLPQVVRDLSNQILSDVDVSADDRLLILSTCTGNTDRLENRYLVVGKLEEETPWDPAA